MAAQRFETEAGVKDLCYLWTKECVLMHPHQAYYDQVLWKVTNAFLWTNISTWHELRLLKNGLVLVWVAIILLLLDTVFVPPTLSCSAAWGWVPFEKAHHWHQTGHQGSSGWKYSLLTTAWIAVMMAITISHRKSTSWSHHWYVQNSGIAKIFQGSSPYITIMQSEVWALITWTIQTSAEGGTLWKLCSWAM